MEFYDEQGRKINHLHIEREEQLQAEKYVPATATVLELGARYGSVTCILSKKIGDPKRIVSVEPDKRVWQALDANLVRNGCAATIVKGFISNISLSLSEIDSWGGYGTTTVKAETSKIPSYTLDHIQTQNCIQFDTLVADCEGFLEMFFDQNPSFYDQLNLILFEKDYPQKCNYAKIETTLMAKGFTCIVSGFHSVWKK